MLLVVRHFLWSYGDVDTIVCIFPGQKNKQNLVTERLHFDEATCCNTYQTDFCIKKTGQKNHNTLGIDLQNDQQKHLADHFSLRNYRKAHDIKEDIAHDRHTATEVHHSGWNR